MASRRFCGTSEKTAVIICFCVWRSVVTAVTALASLMSISIQRAHGMLALQFQQCVLLDSVRRQTLMVACRDNMRMDTIHGFVPHVQDAFRNLHGLKERRAALPWPISGAARQALVELRAFGA